MILPGSISFKKQKTASNDLEYIAQLKWEARMIFSFGVDSYVEPFEVFKARITSEVFHEVYGDIDDKVQGLLRAAYRFESSEYAGRPEAEILRIALELKHTLEQLKPAR